MLGINSNINSLVAQQNLTSSGSALSQAITRLSSGKRINSAADDAAGLAISNIMQTQINGLTQGVSNANDGVSIVQTASSGLSSLTDSLQRIRQLATQAASGSMTDDDRAALQKEVAQQVQEINRIASQTTYNGMNVLNGSLGTVSFQVGANVGQTISMDLSQNTSAAEMGSGNVQAGNTLGSFAVSLDAGGAKYAGPSVITSVKATYDSVAGVTYTDQNGNTLDPTSGAVTTAKAAYAAANIGTGDLDADAQSAQSINGGGASIGGLSLNADGKTAEITSITATDDGAGNVTYADQNGNAVTDAKVIAAAKAAYNASGDGTGDLDADAGAATDKTATQAGLALNPDGSAYTAPTTTAPITQINVLSDGKGGFTLTDQNNVALSAGAAGTIFGTANVGTDANGNTTLTGLTGAQMATDIDTAMGITAGSSADTATATGAQIDQLSDPSTVADIDISTQQGASEAMESIDNALNTINNLQATLGAAQNRFSAIATTQQAQSTDLSTAQSSIQDADFAQETANLSKAQVLQQAGISVLAQANSQPQQILKLLQ